MPRNPRFSHSPRDADCTVYGYGRTLYGEHTAMGRTITQPYLHVCDNSPVRYSSYYGRYTDQYGSMDLYLAK